MSLKKSYKKPPNQQISKYVIEQEWKEQSLISGRDCHPLYTHSKSGPDRLPKTSSFLPLNIEGSALSFHTKFHGIKISWETKICWQSSRRSWEATWTDREMLRSVFTHAFRSLKNISFNRALIHVFMCVHFSCFYELKSKLCSQEHCG